MPDTTARVMRIQGPLREAAAGQLAEPAEGVEASREVGRRLLFAAEAHGFDTSHLWAAVDAGGHRIGQACLVVPAPGHTGMLFTSTPASEDERTELGDVLEAACQDVEGVRLVQALLSPDSGGTGAALQAAGFEWIADLLYLRRTWRSTPAAPRAWPPDLEIQPVRDAGEEALREGLDRSYIDTLDCPGLCRLRSTDDVIASHRATGRHDPGLWWVVRRRGEPAGALLLNPNPDQGHTELVYLGLAPELRGQGLSKRLLAFGLRALKSRKERTVTCAVDARNTPARRLYEEFGFHEFGRRVAYVKPVAESASS